MIEVLSKSPSTKTITQYFPNWHDFVHRAEHGNCTVTTDRSSRATSDRWTKKSMGAWPEVLELAKNGWYSKVVDTKEYLDMTVDRLAKRVQKVRWEHDVTGTDFDMGRLMDGSPDCWVTPVHKIEHGRARKMIRLSVNICVHSGVDCEVVVERGLIIMALCQLLQYNGRRVRLDVQCAIRGPRSKFQTVFNIRCKEFQGMLDVPRCLFAVAHPGALRRLVLSVCECLPLKYAKGIDVGKGYGVPDSIPLNMRGDIHFDKGFFSMDNFDPFQWLLKELKAQGVEFVS